MFFYTKNYMLINNNDVLFISKIYHYLLLTNK